MMYLTNNMEKEAIPLFRIAVEKMQNQPDYWYLLGIALASENKDDEAMAAFRKAIQLEPASVFPRMRLATVLLKSDKPAAINEFVSVTTLESVKAFTLVQVAEALDELGDTENAQLACQRAITLEPKCAQAHLTMSKLLAKRGANEAEVLREQQLATRNVGCDPPLDKTLLQATALGHPIRAGISQAVALAELGNFDTAISTLGNLSKENPQNLDIVMTLAKIHRTRGEIDLAVSAYNEILTSDRGNLQAATDVAQIHIAMQQYSNAETVISQALRVHPNSLELLPLKARLLAMTNRVDEAIGVYRNWIELTQDENARLEFARTLVDLRRLDDAGAEIDLIAKNERASPAVLTLRARVKELQGDYQGAETDLRSAISVNSSSVEPVTSLALMLTRKGEYDSAITTFREGLAVYEGNPAIMNGLAWLLATSPRADLRNGREARELATLACAQTYFFSHGYLDTLGAACAEEGAFSKAQEACRMAIELARRAGMKQSVAEYRSRLELYLRNKPFHLPE